MTDLTNKIIAKAKNRTLYGDKLLDGAAALNQKRLMPIIEAQARIIEELMAKCSVLEKEFRIKVRALHVSPTRSGYMYTERSLTEFMKLLDTSLAREQLQKLVE